MRTLKILGAALVAMFAFGITATSALAAEVKLPDVHVLSGETYPLHLNFEDNGKTTSTLETAGGGLLEGTKGVLVLLLTTELSGLGTFDALFLGVLEIKSKTECNTKGDSSGVVLTAGTFHLVPISLKPLEFGVAFLLEAVTIECPKTKIKVTGCALSTVTKLKAESEDMTEIGGNLEVDKKGKNKLTEYFGDKEEKVKCILESNTGAGAVQSGEAIGEEVVLKALESKMFAILNR